MTKLLHNSKIIIRCTFIIFHVMNGTKKSNKNSYRYFIILSYGISILFTPFESIELYRVQLAMLDAERLPIQHNIIT